MTLGQLTSQRAVLDAIAECDRLGDDEFLSRYGFRRAHRYRLIHAGRSYDSKAIAGVAHGYQFPDIGPLLSADFAGGVAGAAGRLRRLGFNVDDSTTPSPPATPIPPSTPPEPARQTPFATSTSAPGPADALLLGCVKGKRAIASPAADLYTSSLFRKRRAYAEASGQPWFILSALHGLLRPEEVVAPYDMALKDQSTPYRRDWGRRVAAQLGDAGMTMRGGSFEVHAGDAYIAAIRESFEAAGARLTVPLAGLRMGEQLAWYGRSRPQMDDPSADSLVRALGDATAARPAREFPWGRGDLDVPGLYSWYVDEHGAKEISRGIGHPVEPGLVYLGQAGAASPNGAKPSAATLCSRINGNHLRGGIHSSTWRRTLSAVLADHAISVPATGWDRRSEDLLTAWMKAHLSVVVAPVPDPHHLGALERAVLQQLNPPLNLRDVPSTAPRRALSARRSSLTQARSDATPLSR